MPSRLDPITGGLIVGSCVLAALALGLWPGGLLSQIFIALVSEVTRASISEYLNHRRSGPEGDPR